MLVREVPSFQQQKDVGVISGVTAMQAAMDFGTTTEATSPWPEDTAELLKSANIAEDAIRFKVDDFVYVSEEELVKDSRVLRTALAAGKVPIVKVAALKFIPSLSRPDWVTIAPGLMDRYIPVIGYGTSINRYGMKRNYFVLYNSLANAAFPYPQLVDADELFKYISKILIIGDVSSVN